MIKIKNIRVIYEQNHIKNVELPYKNNNLHIYYIMLELKSKKNKKE